MALIDFSIRYLIDQQYEKLEKFEDYQTAWTQKVVAEKELVEALTRKQRRMFHEYIRQRDNLAAVELSHLLEGCTLVLTKDFFFTPRSQNLRTETALPRDGASPQP